MLARIICLGGLPVDTTDSSGRKPLSVYSQRKGLEVVISASRKKARRRIVCFIAHFGRN
jgi:hypothetical protein